MLRSTALALALALCAAFHAQAALRVVATTSDLGALASAVGRDKVTVTVLASPTADPHHVEGASGKDALSNADVLIESGAYLERDWLPALEDAAHNAKVAVGAPGRVLASYGLELIDVPATASSHDPHPAGNSHFMMNPLVAGKVAQGLAVSLCNVDASSCDAYRQNAAAFQDAIDKKLRNWTLLVTPFKGSTIVAFHPSWNYLASRFGLRTEDAETAKPGKGKILIVEPFQSRPMAESVASRIGAVVVNACQFPGCLPGTENDYIALVDADLNAIVAGLKAAKK